jgi:hypothetical protein
MAKKINTTVATECEVEEEFEVSNEVYKEFMKKVRKFDDLEDDQRQEIYEWLCKNCIDHNHLKISHIGNETFFSDFY